jgi:UV DNA damage repair endonuclease
LIASSHNATLARYDAVGFPPVQMVVGVVSYCVTFANNGLKYFRIFSMLFPMQKKSGVYLVF